MSWENSIKEFKYYLKVERSLADNSVNAYIRDIRKLADFCSKIKVDELNVSVNKIIQMIDLKSMENHSNLSIDFLKKVIEETKL